MTSRRDSFRKGGLLGFDSDTKIFGLDNFRKNLEKDFFSEVSIYNCSNTEGETNLSIEMNCNLDLLETLFSYENGMWGDISAQKQNDKWISSFSRSLEQLKELNDTPIDIEEFSIFLNDSTLIINKIYHQSISNELENILMELSKHLAYYTNGLSNIPHEIYIPVFEENLSEDGTTPLKIDTDNHLKKDYFGYWGIYLNPEEEAVIYDLANKCIIPGELFMLND
ncbi:hypothetical protein [Spongiimicrobium salis]|uniref:hypothetical protein n=1 Tax=Spongiimicrobium salis TaxID=1667022 RepID=UPI00374DD9CE